MKWPRVRGFKSVRRENLREREMWRRVSEDECWLEKLKERLRRRGRKGKETIQGSV